MAKKKYYAWTSPNGSGICNSWEECQATCSGWRNEKHKGFATYEEAWAFAYPGIPMPTQENAQKIISEQTNPNLPMEGPVHEAVESLVSADIIVSDEVNTYCKQYGFAHLSEQQKKAVQSVDGKTLLFAVPGSGKTTVLIARTGYMVYARHISPTSIISLTFTKAAAAEMSNRFKEHFKTENAPDFRTIHSLCYSIILPKLRSQGYKYPNNLLGVDSENVEEEEQQAKKVTATALYCKLFKILKCHVSDFETAMEAAQCAITGIKNSVMRPSEYEYKTLKIDGNEVNAKDLFDAYQELLKAKNCMDYDDLLIYAYKGLKNYPEVITSLREKYHYWSIDEAQDNSKLQFMLLNLLCGDDGNIFMVGDDDQSIYSFRGANPRLLLDFGHEPGVNVILMGYNYRSDNDIVNAARDFIECNIHRVDKEMRAFSKESGHVFIPKILASEAEQYHFIAKAAMEAIAKNYTLAVLFRRNVSSLPLIVYMHKNKIPYEANKGIAELLRSKHIKALWRILEYINSPCDLKAFNACRIYLNIHLNKDELDNLKETYKEGSFEPVLEYLRRRYIAAQNEEKSDDISDTIALLNCIGKMRPADAVKTILKEIYIIAADNIGDRLRIYSFLSACDFYKTIGDFINDMHSVIAGEKKKSGEDDPSDFEDNKNAVVTDIKPVVTLSTMHSSKGREFDRVIIVDSFDEIMPGEPRDDALIYDPEEEYRLFYVAVTRAAHRLDLLTVDKYHGNSETVSRFVGAFAFLCEQVCETVDVLVNKITEKAIESSRYLVEPQKFYGVRVGRKSGVYTTWSECQTQINGYSGAEYKSFYSREDAENYVGQIAIPPKFQLDLSEISKIIVSSEGISFNYPIDIPAVINDAVHRHFGVSKIQGINRTDLANLRAAGNFIYSKAGATDYSKITDAYLLIYMPVNFYKIWKPLYQLATAGKLPSECKVLELGAGPGTATLGLMSFYAELAINNPDTDFSLDILAVERETRFNDIFSYLTTSYAKTCPGNLNISIKFVCGDALNYRSEYGNNCDLIIESNMLNLSEDASDHAIDCFTHTVGQAIGIEGHVIAIEPGKQENCIFLNKLANKAEMRKHFALCVSPNLLATDISQISLYKEAIDAGLRSVRKTEHWFSYFILEKVRHDHR